MRGYFLEVADSETSRLEPDRFVGRLRTYRAKALYASSPRSFRPFRALNYAWSLAWLVAYGLSAGRLDGVYVPTSELPHLALAGWIVGKVRRIPIVFCNMNVRGVDVWFANRRLHQTVDLIITISRALAAEIRAEGIRVPVRIGTTGVDDGSTEADAPPKFDAIFVGRHRTEKGVFDLIEAWSRVVRDLPGARLLMVGPVSSDMRSKLTAAIEHAELGDAVEIWGAVDEATKWIAYADAKICLFPSVVEGFGIVPLEANLAGLHVVAYALPVYAETIAGSPAATLVPVGDVGALADAARDAIAAFPDRRNADLARSWAAQFTWEEAGSREERFIGEALRGGSAMKDDAAYRAVEYDAEGHNAQKDAAFSRRVVAFLRKKRKDLGDFVDVGCGTGSVLLAARPFATSLAGIDRAENFLTSARAALPEARIVAGDAGDLAEFETARFDTATFCDVIEHLENPVAALREIRRILKPGGRVLVTTPNSDSIFRRFLGRRWFGLSDATHLLFFTPFSLATLLERSGFEIETSATLSAAAQPAVNAVIDRSAQGGTIVIVARKRNDPSGN